MKLPDHTRYPYGIVVLIEWTPFPGQPGSYKGIRRTSTSEGWRNTRKMSDIVTEIPDRHFWTWDGFDLNRFNTEFLKQEQSNLPRPENDEVMQAISTLENWFRVVSEGEEEPGRP